MATCVVARPSLDGLFTRLLGDESVSRRELLKQFGSVAPIPLGMGYYGYRSDRSFMDRDGDGIPDDLERSRRFDRYLAAVFGEDRFEGLDPQRKDLLIDVRTVGDFRIDPQVVGLLTRRFRGNGIHIQWLEYPRRYDPPSFERRYGSNARNILWGSESFYREAVEKPLKDIAFQIVVVPGESSGPHRGKIYSPWVEHVVRDGRSGWVNGLNVGNRAVIAARSFPPTQARLLLHEIGHLALCHDNSPDNTGVMGTGEEIDLMPWEWAQLRSNLVNIRDTTGYDVALRRCLWSEHLDY